MCRRNRRRAPLQDVVFGWAAGASNPGVPGPDEDADACHVPQALVTSIDGKDWLYLFYATQIGYRKNDGNYHYQYDRIRAMRRVDRKDPVTDGQERKPVIP